MGALQGVVLVRRHETDTALVAANTHSRHSRGCAESGCADYFFIQINIEIICLNKQGLSCAKLISSRLKIDGL